MLTPLCNDPKHSANHTRKLWVLWISYLILQFVVESLDATDVDQLIWGTHFDCTRLYTLCSVDFEAKINTYYPKWGLK